MSASERELADQLRLAYQLPRGPARFAALDAVFRQADAAGLTKFALDARIRAISEFHDGGDPGRAFLAFSWSLATYDRQPELAEHWHTEALLWRFKWMIWALPQFPEIPLARTEAVLDDMQRRYQLGGHSMHAIYQQRWEVAQAVGDIAMAAHWYEQMLAAPRDSLSDCRSCVPTSQAAYLSSLGRDDEAVTVGMPHTQGGCNAQPQSILSTLLLPYVRTGHLDEAVDAHREAYRRLRSDRHSLSLIADHVLFCALTGNEARGLELVENHLSWLERPATPLADMEFCTAAAVVMRQLMAAGRGSLVVSRLSEDGSQRTESTVDELYADLVGRARAIALRFDERNGNTHQSTRVEQRLVTPVLLDGLPLAITAGRGGLGKRPKVQAAIEAVQERREAGDEAGAANALLDFAYALRNAARLGDAIEIAEDALGELDRVGLGDSAYRCRHLLIDLYGHNRDRADDRLAIIEQMLAAPQASTMEPGEAELLTMAASYGGPLASPRRLRALQLYRAAGDAEHALQVAETAMYQVADAAEAVEFVRLYDEVRSGPVLLGKARSAGLERSAITALARVGLLDAALARLDAFVPAPDLPWMISEAQRLRCAIQLRRGDLSAAEAQARDMLVNAASDEREVPAALLVQALRAQNRDAEAQAVIFEHQLGVDVLAHDHIIDWDDAS